jgi:hypothetical protein
VFTVRFRETPIIPGGGSGSALLPEPRRCHLWEFSHRRPAVTLLVLAVLARIVQIP